MNELPLPSAGAVLSGAEESRADGPDGGSATVAEDTSSTVAEVERACAALRAGAPVVLGGDDGRGALMAAAETLGDVLPRRLAALARGETLLLLLTARRAAALTLEKDAPPDDGNSLVALAAGDLSAAEIATLADPTLLARADAERMSAGQALRQAAVPAGLGSAAVELTKLAKLLPAALLAPLGAGGESAAEAAARLGLPLVDVRTVVDYRDASVRSLVRVTEAMVPLEGAGDARLIAFRPRDGSTEHLAIVIGAPAAEGPVLLRVHSECFTGDLLASLRCDCGDQLRGAIRAISAEGAGLLLYLSQEGRGIGLVNKLRAYRLQDAGADTAEANEQLGFDADERVYLPAAEMLRQLGFCRVRLLTNNPDKVAALERCGIAVEERVSHSFPSNDHNAFYLDTKARRFGHSF